MYKTTHFRDYTIFVEISNFNLAEPLQLTESRSIYLAADENT